jgi:hypothetical protein
MRPVILFEARNISPVLSCVPDTAEMALSFSTTISLAALATAAAAPTAAQAATSPILQIRQAQFDADVHRVVFDMVQLPAETPQLVPTNTGWRVAFADQYGHDIRTDIKMAEGRAIKRIFYLPKTNAKPARLVMDFTKAASPIVPVAAAPVAEPVVAAIPVTAKSDAPGFDASYGAPEWQPQTNNQKSLIVSGMVEAEGRWFPKSSDDGPLRQFFGSLAIEPRLQFQFKADHKFSLIGFGRVDTATAARTHVDVREAKYEGRFGALDVTLGVDRRFWGQLEAAHLVDVVNQIDTLEDIDAEDKLGQPLAEVKWTGRKASFAVMALPYFRDRSFPQRPDRPNAPMLVTGKAIRDGVSNHWTPDFAARGTLTSGPFDLALQYFNGLNREPRMILTPTALTPVYDRMSQFGGDALAVLGPVRLKAEGYYRRLRNDKVAAAKAHGGFGLGVEYSFAGAIGAGDLNLLTEYYHDTRGRDATTIFDSDIFAGFRYTGNDVASSELLGGVLFDTRRSSKFVTLEASRRLSDAFKLSLDARMPVSVAADDPLAILRDDGFVQLKLQLHF